MSTLNVAIRTRPGFSKEPADGFYQLLKKRAAETIVSEQASAKRATWMKTLLYPGMYLTAYCLLIIKGESMVWLFSCYSAMGLLTTMIIFNIVHDAIHHSLFSHPSTNGRAAMLLDILGGNSYIWNKRHVVFHHSYTNIPGWDLDIKSPVCRFDANEEYKKGYQFQILYMPIIYLFYSLNWILMRDFKDFFQKGAAIRKGLKIKRIEYFKLVLFKLFHATYIFVLPVLLLPHPVVTFVYAFLLMHFLMSALTLLVLLPSHLDEDASFPVPDENMQLADTWAMHQLRVTNDFGTKNPVLNFIMGGLNHHIAHHLFPNVNHNIIPGITKIISETAEEKKLPYKCFTLKEVMKSHVKLLKKNGQLHHVMEE
jgi:linoleoyl-CoA desaturase